MAQLVKFRLVGDPLVIEELRDFKIVSLHPSELQKWYSGANGSHLLHLVQTGLPFRQFLLIILLGFSPCFIPALHLFLLLFNLLLTRQST